MTHKLLLYGNHQRWIIFVSPVGNWGFDSLVTKEYTPEYNIFNKCFFRQYYRSILRTSVIVFLSAIPERCFFLSVITEFNGFFLPVIAEFELKSAFLSVITEYNNVFFVGNAGVLTSVFVSTRTRSRGRSLTDPHHYFRSPPPLLIIIFFLAQERGCLLQTVPAADGKVRSAELTRPTKQQQEQQNDNNDNSSSNSKASARRTMIGLPRRATSPWRAEERLIREATDWLQFNPSEV